MSKFLIFSSIFVLFLFGSCSTNSNGSDDDNNNNNNNSKPITPENVLGTWEIYYFTKRMRPAGTQSGTGTTRRHAEYDGYRITFENERKTYFETNPLKQKTINGTYSVDESTSSITLKYASPHSGKDSTTVMRITRMDDGGSLYTRVIEYPLSVGDLKYEVEDIQYLRNIDKAPNAHPNVDKVALSRENMTGSWKVKKYTKTIDGTVDSAAGDTIVNSVYKFDKDYTYKAYSPDGEFIQHGPYAITDDVIHMYNSEDYSKDPSVFMVIQKSEKSFTHYFRQLLLPSNKVPQDWIIEAVFEKVE